jgi:thiol-disulfide isomerase/thioredoxin
MCEGYKSADESGASQKAHLNCMEGVSRCPSSTVAEHDFPALLQAINRRTVLSALAALCLCTTARARARIVRWDPAKPTPALNLTSVDGVRWSVDSLRGKGAVLNFWASWCEPCVAEMPQLDELARLHSSDGKLAVLGINYQEGEAAIRHFSDRIPVSFPLLRDPDGTAFRSWGGTVLPSTVLLSRSARALTIIHGEMDWRSVHAAELLRPLLAGDP